MSARKRHRPWFASTEAPIFFQPQPPEEWTFGDRHVEVVVDPYHIGAIDYEHRVFERYRPHDDPNLAKRGRFYGLRVLWDSDFGLSMVSDEQVTGPGPTAKRLDSEVGVVTHDDLALTHEEVRWLHATLGELLLVLDDEARAADARGEVGP